MMIKYLKEEGFYSDLYDLITVEKCLRIRDFWEKMEKDSKDGEVKVLGWVLDFKLYFVKGERYRRRRSVLQEWMDQDRKKDEKLVSAEAPADVRCLKCQSAMKVVFKDLYDMSCESLRVLFFFDCLTCGKRRGVFEDGQEFVSSGAKLTKEEMQEWDDEDAQRKIREKKDKEILEQYRQEFCLSEKEGEEYIMNSDRLKEFSRFLKERKEKEIDPDYQKAISLRKLTIVELEIFLKGVLEKEKYIKLDFDKPVIDRHVIVPVTVQDGDVLRKQDDSVRKIQRVLKKVLEGTNWRLMSQGVSYRLGYLSFKLKGYEQEDDLIKIVKSKKS